MEMEFKAQKTTRPNPKRTKIRSEQGILTSLCLSGIGTRSIWKTLPETWLEECAILHLGGLVTMNALLYLQEFYVMTENPCSGCGGKPDKFNLIKMS